MLTIMQRLPIHVHLSPSPMLFTSQKLVSEVWCIPNRLDCFFAFIDRYTKPFIVHKWQSSLDFCLYVQFLHSVIYLSNFPM